MVLLDNQDGRQNCMTIRRDMLYKWDDIECENQNYPICQEKKSCLQNQGHIALLRRLQNVVLYTVLLYFLKIVDYKRFISRMAQINAVYT